MKDEDEDEQPSPSDDELREAAALAAALEGDGVARGDGGTPPPGDALEAASLLRHTRAPLAVPPAHEPIAAAQVRPALDARGAGRRRRARVWIATSLLAPAAAAAWLLFATTLPQRAAPPVTPIVPPPPADLLAAQAQATRGGAQASAALAALDLKMRAYRRQYHDGLRRRGGGTR